MEQQKFQLYLNRVSLTTPVNSYYLLKDVSFGIEKGSWVGVVGPSGSGKTSLLRLLNRLSSPTGGSIYLKNQDYRKIPIIELRQKITLVLQESRLLGMSVAEAIAYPLKLRGLRPSEVEQRCEYWIEQLKIPDDWLSRSELQLSVGQKQLVAIARAAAIQPEILLLDEPTSALDVGSANLVLSALIALAESGVTIIMTNHQLDLVQQFCTQLLYLNQGELIQDLPQNQVDWLKLRDSIIQQQLQQSEEWN